VIRRVEAARDAHLVEIERRTLALKQQWDANRLDPSQLRDPAFVAAALHPSSAEVARAYLSCGRPGRLGASSVSSSTTASTARRTARCGWSTT